MPEMPAAGQTALEVVSPDNSIQRVPLTESPFYVGRGQVGNHLPLADQRISRRCAAIVSDGGRYYLEDRGHHLGLFVQGRKVTRQALEDRDVITFGLDDSYKLVFHSSASDTASIQKLLTRMGNVSETGPSSGELSKLNLLLEATRLLHSQLPLDAVLNAMLDRAISITNADRGLLLEADASGALTRRLARSSGAVGLAAEDFSPSQTAVGLALKQRSGVITEDLHHAAGMLQGAQSVIAQRLRSVVAIPLYAMPRANSAESVVLQRGQFLGVLYLDSRRPTAFSKVDRQILDAIAIGSASILDNARLVKHDRERQRVEQELGIARDIQQALLPKGFRDFPHLKVGGMNSPCHAVGGDYFDVFPIDETHTAFLVADVSGKGLGAALVTTMLQGALSGMTIGADPAKVFEHLNGFLCQHAEVGRYATLFFGIVDCDGRLEYLNAGHPSPLLLRRGEVTELFTEGSFPVGLIPEAKYTAAHGTLEPGDTLVLFSDGVTEAEDPEEELYGVPRLRDVVAGQHDASLDHLQQVIVESVESFTRGAPQADDLTILLVRYRAAAQATTSAS
jgi:sigma-B regulation protein RsbU (phosphoserine phosphatase)